MTDVLILKRIPGARPGQILQLDERLQKHVSAGNAKILPNENPGFGYVPKAADPAPVLAMTGSAREQDDQLELDELEDEDTDEDTED